MEVLVFGAAGGGTTATAGVIRHLGVLFPGANARCECPSVENLWPDCGPRFAEWTEKYGSWGVKIPALTEEPRVLEQALAFLRTPRGVFVWRDFWALQREGARSARGAKARLSQCMATAEFLDQHKLPVLHLSYERLVVNPRQQVERIGSFLGVVDVEKIRKAADWIKPGGYRDWTP